MMSAVSQLVTRVARLRAARVIAVAALAACDPSAHATVRRADGPGVAAPSAPSAPSTSLPADAVSIVDSILPPDEELRRFQAGLVNPQRLVGGAGSREALVRQFVEHLAARDTAGLQSLLVTRAEFAFLLYPGSSYTRPPYRTPPGLVWLQLEQDTRKGLARLLRQGFEVGRYVGHRCGANPVMESDARLWRRCRARVTLANGDTLDARLFGVVVEHGGRFKFASLETDF